MTFIPLLLAGVELAPPRADSAAGSRAGTCCCCQVAMPPLPTPLAAAPLWLLLLLLLLLPLAVTPLSPGQRPDVGGRV